MVKGQSARFIVGHNAMLKWAYEVDPKTGCWNYLGAKDKQTGYGRMNRSGRAVWAHRWYYEQAKGPIPSGLQIDHLCRNRACVNPDHLEAVRTYILDT